MKFKNKGRKIYKTKEKNYYGKSASGKFFSGALTVLLIGGICFIGYSVAEPIINYTKKKGDNNIVATDTSETTSDTSEIATATAATINVQENINIEQYKAFSLTVNDILDANRLKTALQKVPSNQEIEYIAVPLKVSGGEIYYASTVNEAQMSGAIKSTMTLLEITSEIRTAGYKPTAEISVLRDNLLPQTYSETGYQTTDDGSRWIDDSSENGGKPWISPFSDSAVSYISSITDEISAADFDKIICSDFVFPPFRESDLALLGDDVNSSERYLGLTSLANLMYSRILDNGSSMMLEVSAVDLLQGNDEIIQPMLLDVNTLILDVDFDEMGNAVSADNTVYEFTGTASENASKVIGLVQHKLSDYNIAVRIRGENTTETELLKAKEVIAEYGYTSFIIG